MADKSDTQSFDQLEVDSSGEHHKTVFAHFGSAVYFAQCLEHGLVNALVYLDLIPNHPRPVRTPEEWVRSLDGFMDKQFENTLGQLIAQLRKVASVPDDLSSKLKDALTTRNWLAHDYFRERALEWISPDGRDRMIDELVRCRRRFIDADRLLDATFKPIREKHGFTDKRLNQAYEEMMAEAYQEGK